MARTATTRLSGRSPARARTHLIRTTSVGL
jgi:hypothetical protein